MTRKIFVTGTGTGVGKTLISRAIILAARLRGLNVAAFKPVETGAKDSGAGLVPKDATLLFRASNRGGSLSEVCAFCFPEPVSPHLAASKVGARIDPDTILTLLDSFPENADLAVAEGAGGFLVPLSNDLLYADLIGKSGFSLIVVSPNELGSINSTLLTIESVRKRGIDLVGVILNRTPRIELDNASAIASFGKVRILGEFPTVDDEDDDALLARVAKERIDLDRILSG